VPGPLVLLERLAQRLLVVAEPDEVADYVDERALAPPRLPRGIGRTNSRERLLRPNIGHGRVKQARAAAVEVVERLGSFPEMPAHQPEEVAEFAREDRLLDFVRLADARPRHDHQSLEMPSVVSRNHQAKGRLREPLRLREEEANVERQSSSRHGRGDGRREDVPDFL